MELEQNKSNNLKKKKVSKKVKSNSINKININNGKINNKVKKTTVSKAKVPKVSKVSKAKVSKVSKAKVSKVSKAKVSNNNVKINNKKLINEEIINKKINNGVKKSKVSKAKVSKAKVLESNVLKVSNIKNNKSKVVKVSKVSKAKVSKNKFNGVIIETVNEKISTIKNIIENISSKNINSLKVNKNLEIKNKINKHMKDINNVIKDNSSLKSSRLLKHLITIGYPKKKYIAYQSYEGTQIINKNPVSNFTRKYKKKFIYDHEDKDIICNEKCMKLFDNSYYYMSSIQTNLLKKNISNYISGGAGLKLYSLYADVKNTENIYLTKDYDLYLYLENTEKNSIITNSTILKNISNITDSIIEVTGTPKYSFLELYIILNYDNNKTFYEMFKIFIDNGFDLYSYMSFVENDTYIFKFVKLIGDEFCLRLKIKFLKIDEFIKEKIYSYMKITFYRINKTPNGQFVVENVYIPLEILIKNKNDCNLELMKGELTINQNKYYIYNEHTLLYNLIHLYYKYNTNTGNTKIPLKKAEGKDIRDEKRLNLFFTIYCKLLHPKLSQKEVDKLLKKLKSISIEFKNNIESIKNFDVIDNVFLK